MQQSWSWLEWPKCARFLSLPRKCQEWQQVRMCGKSGSWSGCGTRRQRPRIGNQLEITSLRQGRSFKPIRVVPGCRLTVQLINNNRHDCNYISTQIAIDSSNSAIWNKARLAKWILIHSETEQNRTEQNRTEQNRSVIVSIIEKQNASRNRNGPALILAFQAYTRPKWIGNHFKIGVR